MVCCAFFDWPLQAGQIFKNRFFISRILFRTELMVIGFSGVRALTRNTLQGNELYKKEGYNSDQKPHCRKYTKKKGFLIGLKQILEPSLFYQNKLVYRLYLVAIVFLTSPVR